MTDKDYLKFAVSAAKHFGILFVKNFGKVHHIKSKGGDGRDLVTEVDRQIETEFRALVAKNFPDHKIIGEEFGKDQVTSKDLIWIIDPVDGTTNYIQGLYFSCISIALWRGNKPLVGIVYNPVTKQLFYAQAGRGAFLNGKKIRVSRISKFEQAFTAFCWGKSTHKAAENFPRLVKQLHKIRTFGSTALEICFIACGMLDALISYEANVWDFAAAALILQEAGGQITEYSGKPINLKTASILASNGKIHKQFLKKI